MFFYCVYNGYSIWFAYRCWHDALGGICPKVLSRQCGILAGWCSIQFHHGFFRRDFLQERQIPFLPHHQWGLWGCRRPMTHFHIWWLTTKPPVFHHKKLPYHHPFTEKYIIKLSKIVFFLMDSFCFFVGQFFWILKKNGSPIVQTPRGWLFGIQTGPKSLIPCLEGVANDRDQNFHGKQKMMKVEVMGIANKKKTWTAKPSWYLT